MSEQPVPQVPQEPEQHQPQYIPPYVPPVDIPQAEQPAYQQAQYVPPTQDYSDPSLTADDKTWGGLSYIPIVGLVVLFLQEKASRPIHQKTGCPKPSSGSCGFCCQHIVWLDSADRMVV